MQIRLLTTIFSLFCLSSFSQGTCATALPFCTGSNYTFPASTNTSGPPGNNFGCLGTQPNPAFYYMEVDNGGNFTIDITTNPQEDIDFICWGPFTNFNTICSQLNTAPIADCSYSGNSNETCQINGATAGEYYMLLITNYSNNPTDISFSQTAGNGTTNCCILSGDAGDDNIINVCEQDPQFNLIDQLLGTPSSGGNWYNPLGFFVNNTVFNPITGFAGTYSYIVTGNPSNCPNDTSFLTINVNSNPVINFPTINDICSNGDSLLLNTATPNGGIYSVNGVTSNGYFNSVGNVGVNTIIYTYLDSNFCIDTASQNIIVNDSPVATSITSNVSCFGLNDGAINISISGGTPSYIEDWGGYNPLALSAGEYGIIVTDSNNCVFIDTITIYEPPGFSSSLIFNDIDCFGNTADASITSQIISSQNSFGNTSLFNYCNSLPGSNLYTSIDNVILNGDNININNNTSGACDQYEDYISQFADLTQGQSYTISITLGDCSGLDFPSGAKVYADWNIDGDFLDINEEIGEVPFGSNSSATITFTPPFAGGYGPTRLRIVSQFLTSQSNISISPCDVGLFNPPNYAEPWYGATEDYSIVIYPDTTNFSYSWLDSTTNIIGSQNNISGLIAGEYSVITTNPNGCIITDSLIINEPNILTSTNTITNVSCNSLSDGAAVISISGGITDYTISAAGFNQTLSGGLNSFTIPPMLNAGDYPYSVSDSNGCILNDTITITEPLILSSIENINNVSCNGFTDGSIILNISGGTAPYTENWGANNPLSLSAGSYLYSVSDDNGCLLSNSINIEEPLAISISALQSDVSACLANDGFVDVNISGGTPPFTYLWSNNETTEDISNLGAGTYVLNAIDSNGCSTTISATINEPPAILLSHTKIDASCFGSIDGSIDVSVLSGTAPFSFIWTNNSSNEDISNLSAGIYTLSVSDSVGCSENLSITINEPPASNIISSQINVNCFGASNASISILISGGTSPYNFIWSNNDTTQSISNLSIGTYSYSISDAQNCIYLGDIVITEPDAISVNPIVSDVSCFSGNDGFSILNISGGVSPYTENWGAYDPAALSAGDYLYTVIDSNGCNYIDSITIIQPDQIIINSSVQDALCNGANDGSASLQIIGGIPPYIQDWGVNNPNSLSAGVYNFSVNDDNNCIIQGTVTVGESAAIQTIENNANVSCYGFSDGTSTLLISGGTAPYTNNWGANDPTSLSAGIYYYSVTDSLNCILNDSIIITEPTQLMVNELLTNVSCFGLSDGIAFLQISGGTAPYNEDWAGTNNLALSQGNYGYTITDNNGCVETDFINIYQPNPIILNITVSDANCFNGNNGSIYVGVSGGTSPYSENWFGNDPLALSAGNYSFSITDDNGCRIDSSATVNQADQIFANYSAQSPICRDDKSTLSIKIIDPLVNQYSLVIDNQIYIVDSLGILIPEGIPIQLLPSSTVTTNLTSITDSDGCTSPANNSSTIVVNMPPALDILIDNVCESYPSFVLDQALPQGGTYLIDGQISNIFDIENLETGDYIITYLYTDPITNCSNSTDKIVSILPAPIANFTLGPQTTDIDNPNIFFLNKSEQVNSLIWNMGDGQTILDSISFNYTYSDTGKYIIELIISNQYGCGDTIQDSVIINPIYTCYIPNAFTPNDDGKNDSFGPVMTAMKSYSIRIYDRWGGIVFNEENKEWDGADYPKGIYNYNIEAIDYKNKVFRYAGKITLAR